MDLKTILKEQYSGLPDSLKSYIDGSSWRNSLKTIAWKYNLSEEKSESINSETIFILFGLASYKDFRQNLLNSELEMPQETINTIVDEIDSSIFQPIRISLDEVDIKEKENESVIIDSGEIVNKTQVLDEVENPIKTPPAYEKLPNANTSNIIDDKLSKVVKLPRQEEHSENRAPVSGQNKYSTDPYREPIE